MTRFAVGDLVEVRDKSGVWKIDKLFSYAAPVTADAPLPRLLWRACIVPANGEFDMVARDATDLAPARNRSVA